MAFSKKGSRKIEVNDQSFIYKISKPKPRSTWYKDESKLDNTFLQYAQKFGLGRVQDVIIYLVIQSISEVSTLHIKCHTVLIDGFLGPEQILQIKPALVSKLIVIALQDGWEPEKKGDHKMEIIHQQTKEHRPVILQLPNMNENIDDYDNIERPIEIFRDT